MPDAIIHIVRHCATPTMVSEMLQSEVQFEALINIRPRQNNPSMTILDPVVRTRVETIVRQLLEGVMPE